MKRRRRWDAMLVGLWLENEASKAKGKAENMHRRLRTSRHELCPFSNNGPMGTTARPSRPLAWTAANIDAERLA